ncbi:hypothetical protein [Pseudochryseolinea flava]|uniref:Uncharacterized protein n=1 Tax=Pseudochryseolinea flava TaxID=2059302 RepID=A0A364Y8X0_9BACT|nr:hypothetical protein [Pseudochryseolinea flava]RAW02300.1 hypothetical protein DQQ10_07135 [Pseudochryseolinea flava]
MNVVFHATAAMGIVVLITDTQRLGNKPTLTNVTPTALFAFTIGVVSHGALDFIPHCYPVNSKVDVITGLAMILFSTWIVHSYYRPIVGLTCLGAILPDVVDLGPKIIDKQLNLGLQLPGNIFPWHWHTYSGSLYNGECAVSSLNHLLLFVTVGMIFWARRTDVKVMLRHGD